MERSISIHILMVGIFIFYHLNLPMYARVQILCIDAVPNEVNRPLITLSYHLPCFFPPIDIIVSDLILIFLFLQR